MGFEHLYDFLERLQVNKNKEWMEVNRKEYQTVRLWFIDWLTEMQERLVEIDPDYTDTDVKRSINRINNNLMFQPNKPIYKDHFGAGLDLSYHEKQNDFYLQVGVEQSFIADCLNCTQMSNEWIDDVLVRMESTNVSSTQNLAAEIRAFDQVNTITKTVSGVNRSTGELVIVAIN